jgi:hypothetical protein
MISSGNRRVCLPKTFYRESNQSPANAGARTVRSARPTQMSRSASPARQAQCCEEPFITGLTCSFREERIVEVDHSRCARGVSLFECVQCRPGLAEAEPDECEIDRNIGNERYMSNEAGELPIYSYLHLAEREGFEL